MHVVLDLVDRLYEWTQRAIEEHTSGGFDGTEVESTSLPQPRQWQSPDYSEAPRRVTPRKTFQRAEQQSISRWVMGRYNAAPAKDIVTRNVMPEQGDEFSRYISLRLKQSILERYADEPAKAPFISGHPGDHEEMISIAKRVLESEPTLQNEPQFVNEITGDGYASVVPLLAPDEVTGFAKVVARRQFLTVLAAQRKPFGDEVARNRRLDDLIARAYEELITGEAPTPQTMLDLDAIRTELAELDYLQYALRSKGDVKVMHGIASDEKAPAAVLAQLTCHPDITVRCLVAENPATPVEALWILIQDEETSVRYAVAECLHVPTDVLTQLADDENEYVSSRASKTLSWLLPSKVIKHSLGKARPLRSVS